MKKPFELSPEKLAEKLEEMVDATISDLGSEFLLMPEGPAFTKYEQFSKAYETLKKCTSAFRAFTEARILEALLEDSRSFCVLRAILGMTPPEWAELARSEFEVDVPQNAARTLDRKCRENGTYVKQFKENHATRSANAKIKGRKKPEEPITLRRIEILLKAAIHFIIQGAPREVEGVIHRLAKFDTRQGIDSVRYAALENIPYAVLLYERYLGRPFAAHRDAVSELVGEVWKVWKPEMAF